MISFFKQCQLSQNLKNGHKAFVNSAWDIFMFVCVFDFQKFYFISFIS